MKTNKNTFSFSYAETPFQKPLLRIFQVLWLPVFLILLLIFETYYFNRWLNIIPQLYFVRRTAASVGLGTLLFGPALLFTQKRSRYLYLFIVSLLVSLVFVSQYIYVEYSGGFLQASALSYAGQTSDLFGTIRTLLSVKLLLFVSPLVFIVASFFIAHGAQKAASLFTKEKIIAAILMVCVTASGYGTVLILEKHDWGDTTRLYSKLYDLATLVGKVGIVNFYIENLVQYAFQSHQATPQDISFVSAWAKNRVPPAQGSDFGKARGRNVFFIQIESLENWVINTKVGNEEITPNLNKLATAGIDFTNYYSQIAEGNTADAEFATMNSLYPLPDTVAFITKAQNKYAALPAELQNNGYTTAVFHGDVPTFWNRSNMYPSLGYQKQFSRQDYTVPRPVGFDGLGDDDFFQQSLPKVTALHQPFLATLITLSSHTPFIIPKDLQTLDIPQNSTLTATQKDYVESVHYTDMAVGKFIENLKTAGLYDNSIILIYGDHNAFIGTEDSAKNQVPLLLLTPGLSVHATSTEPASHVDLYPTVSDLLGIKPPSSVLGQDILTTKTPVVIQRQAGSGAVKFIMDSQLLYTGSSDGEFSHGTCMTIANNQDVPVQSCQQLYTEQTDTTKVSDIVVRYNQLPLLNP